ncbi:unnamed protein product [Clonostachys solani]|uniref:Uncharacterized protein n=1 Tax=Clonostachys solani TaxID=160281 RepID=A0A9N9ZQ70_9HYPO|nr:unnamed protein product [Clonostachys solani]
MVVPRLCKEILLRIFEFSDMETISSLMEIDELCHLLQTYEKSITRNIHRMSSLVAPDDGNSPFILTYDVSALEEPSPDQIEAAKRSGSDDYPRAKPELVVMKTFDGNDEMWRRDREIDVLLRAPALLIENSHDGTPHSWPVFPNTESKTLLQALLKRAMNRCDVLVDMEGRAMYELATPSSWYDYMPEPEGATARDLCYSSATTSPCNNQWVINGVLMPGLTLKLQKEYLQTLPLDTLIELYFAGTYLAECRHQTKCEPTMDLEYFKRDHAFQEAALRHGSWAVYNEFRGYGGRAKHIREVRDQICKAMVLRPNDDPTQSDVWRLDGLRTMLHRMLLSRLEGEGIREQGALRAEVYKRVGAEIGAPDAFENPPSLEGRPAHVENVNFEWL